MRSGLARLLGILFILGDTPFLPFDFNYSQSSLSKFSVRKENYAYHKNKTSYQNHFPNNQQSYYNKTIPRNRYSRISLKGIEIKKNNQRKLISKNLEKKTKS